MYSLSDIFDALGSSLNFEEMLDHILTVALRELSADQGSLLLLEGENNSTLTMLAARGLPEEIVRRGYIQRKGSISEYVIRERRPLILNEMPRSPKFEAVEAGTGRYRRIFSALCVPLVVRDHVIGTLNLNRTRNECQFTQPELETCSIVASQAAIIIENRRLQQEVIQNERLAAVGMTVASISHCVKNILTGVRGGLDITERGLRDNDNEMVRSGYEMLKRNAVVMSNLVLDLLDYSKEREPLRETAPLGETLRRVIETIRYKADSNNVILEESIPLEIDYHGDHDQIFRAVLNLATNAVEACAGFDGARNGPRVEIGLRVFKEERAWIAISVTDNGPGIPDDVRNRIWDLFYSTKGSRGTGIGLAVSRKMIEEHGGRIIVESVPGAGTTFTILLPMDAE